MTEDAHAASLGQLHGRTERIKQTSDWLNATPIGLDGLPIETVEIEGMLSSNDLLEVYATVGLIQRFLEEGETVQVTERDPKIRAFIKSYLTDEELSHVVFDPDD